MPRYDPPAAWLQLCTLFWPQLTPHCRCCPHTVRDWQGKPTVLRGSHLPCVAFSRRASSAARSSGKAGPAVAKLQRSCTAAETTAAVHVAHGTDSIPGGGAVGAAGAWDYTIRMNYTRYDAFGAHIDVPSTQSQAVHRISRGINLEPQVRARGRAAVHAVVLRRNRVPR